MQFQPDLIVTGPEGVTLVIEAKTTLPNFEQTEDQLRHYMFVMRCPMGMLITPNRMWLYRDLYASPPAIERVGEFDMSGSWQQPPPADAVSFESFVQQWLERLAQQPARNFPRNLSDSLREYVLPAIATGDLRAAHPRNP